MLTICEYEQIINRSANQTMIVTFMEYMLNYTKKKKSLWNRKSLVHFKQQYGYKNQKTKKHVRLIFFPSQAIHRMTKITENNNTNENCSNNREIVESE